ncbi:MAG: hypothetical protein M1824_005075 [Vezdaea acicularis]|nr:MAG: hypothetical protein M1824_005075 [Vezdaea acicularis]
MARPTSMGLRWRGFPHRRLPRITDSAAGEELRLQYASTEAAKSAAKKPVDANLKKARKRQRDKIKRKKSPLSFDSSHPSEKLTIVNLVKSTSPKAGIPALQEVDQHTPLRWIHPYPEINYSQEENSRSPTLSSPLEPARRDYALLSGKLRPGSDEHSVQEAVSLKAEGRHGSHKGVMGSVLEPLRNKSRPHLARSKPLQTTPIDASVGNWQRKAYEELQSADTGTAAVDGWPIPGWWGSMERDDPLEDESLSPVSPLSDEPTRRTFLEESSAIVPPRLDEPTHRPPPVPTDLAERTRHHEIQLGHLSNSTRARHPMRAGVLTTMSPLSERTIESPFYEDNSPTGVQRKLETPSYEGAWFAGAVSTPMTVHRGQPQLRTPYTPRARTRTHYTLHHPRPAIATDPDSPLTTMDLHAQRTLIWLHDLPSTSDFSARINGKSGVGESVFTGAVSASREEQCLGARALLRATPPPRLYSSTPSSSSGSGASSKPAPSLRNTPRRANRRKAPNNLTPLTYSLPLSQEQLPLPSIDAPRSNGAALSSSSLSPSLRNPHKPSATLSTSPTTKHTTHTLTPSPEPPPTRLISPLSPPARNTIQTPPPPLPSCPRHVQQKIQRTGRPPALPPLLDLRPELCGLVTEGIGGTVERGGAAAAEDSNDDSGRAFYTPIESHQQQQQQQDHHHQAHDPTTQKTKRNTNTPRSHIWARARTARETLEAEARASRGREVGW